VLQAGTVQTCRGLGGVEQGEFPDAGIDFDRANAARMYDFFLGGAHNFAVDREHAAHVLVNHPNFVSVCRANRAYLGRVVRWCVDRGIDQFLDLGSGVPTVGNVHEIAHRFNPAARVAYVDFEPVAVAHARALLAGLDTVTVTPADLRVPRTVLEAPTVAGLLDFTRPVAVLATFVLHFVSGDGAAILGRYRAALAPGSVIAISHGSDDHDDPQLVAEIRAVRDAYRGSANEGTLRTRSELLEFFTGMDLTGPGLVDITHWPHPQPDQPATGALAAVAVVP